jgi:hypothetical protein
MVDKIVGLSASSQVFRAQDLVVDLSPEPAKAKVVREGYQVPAVALDDKKASFFLDNLQQITPKLEPRVVSQTVPPGTKVLPGTAVDLVLAVPSDIPFNIFDNLHSSLKEKNINFVTEGILNDPNIRQTLLKYDTPDSVAPADKAALTAAFNANSIPVNDASADTSFGAAFNSVRGALAFR